MEAARSGGAHQLHLLQAECQTWKHLPGPSHPELRGPSEISNRVPFKPDEWELASEQKPACLRIAQRYIASKASAPL